MTLPDLSADAALVALRGIEGVVLGTEQQTYARVVWNVIAEPGDGAAGALISAVGPLEALRVAATPTEDEWAAARARWAPRLRPDAVRGALDGARRVGARLVVPGDPAWPSRVDDLGVHAPVALWVRGRAEDQNAPAVAIVGARAATAYGEGVTADLSADLGASGVTIVSGAAYGIDGAAHRAALSTGARTVAFLAGGVDRPYPRGHEGLLGRIASTGAVWSETPCGTRPTKWRFLSRNRLIAAMADAVVVVEAGWRSGSLNTAAHAATLGRELGAVPGPITSAASAGCHRILREYGGVCVTSAKDVLEMLGCAPGPEADAVPSLDEGRTDDTTRVIDSLSTRVARGADEIARRSGLSIAHVQTHLGLAALEGRAVRDDEGRWRAAAG
ncbi:DNA-binding protein [Microbacterium testaceum]|uniref:DNA-binding protein n=1 Tax=Microbacterium testaceum TaxID=2033 RepID=A0A147EV77_MICTE|nr:DNA-processing protein DprA [Microbacterium testaceum]KTR93459.1 DNA-binding protein [Microbacterium testaceum]